MKLAKPTEKNYSLVGGWFGVVYYCGTNQMTHNEGVKEINVVPNSVL